MRNMLRLLKWHSRRRVRWQRPTALVGAFQGQRVPPPGEEMSQDACPAPASVTAEMEQLLGQIAMSPTGTASSVLCRRSAGHRPCLAAA